MSWDAVEWKWTLGILFFGIGAMGMVLIGGCMTKNKSLLKFSLVIFGVFVAFAAIVGIFSNLRAYGPWEKLDEGNFDRVEYTDTHVRRLPVGRLPVGSRVIHDTILYFEDGRTRIIPGLHQLQFAKGTYIIVFTKNDFYKIEPALDPSAK